MADQPDPDREVSEVVARTQQLADELRQAIDELSLLLLDHADRGDNGA